MLPSQALTQRMKLFCYIVNNKDTNYELYPLHFCVVLWQCVGCMVVHGVHGINTHVAEPPPSYCFTTIHSTNTCIMHCSFSRNTLIFIKCFSKNTLTLIKCCSDNSNLFTRMESLKIMNPRLTKLYQKMHCTPDISAVQYKLSTLALQPNLF